MAKPNVFISHSHEDDAFAERLVRDLNAAGADAWLDNQQLGAGDFQERISAAIDACDWFVLVLTRNALASKWVRQEVHAANHLRVSGQIRDLIVLQAGPFDQCELPALWRILNRFDARNDYVAALNRVLTVTGLTPLSDPPVAAPEAEPDRELDELLGDCVDEAVAKGDWAMELLDPRQALVYYDGALTMAPSNLEPHRKLELQRKRARALLADHRPKEALPLLEGLIHSAPDGWQDLFWKAEALRKLHRMVDAEEAEYDYSEALSAHVFSGGKP